VNSLGKSSFFKCNGWPKGCLIDFERERHVDYVKGKIMSESQQDRTVSYATFKDTMLPVKQAVLDGVNDYEEHRKAPPEVRDRHECELRRRLEIFKTQFPADFPFRTWHVLIMEAMVISTLGEYAKAIELDQRSLDYAGSIEQKSISYLNISEISRHAHQFQESLITALKAYHLNPGHKGIVLNLAIALGACHRFEDADNIRRVLHQEYNPGDPKDLVGLYERYSEEWRKLQLRLDSLREMTEASKEAGSSC